MGRLILVVLALFLVGCAPDLTGIEDLSRYAEDVLEHATVSEIVCESTTLAVGEETQCQARGGEGQVLQHSGSTVVMWSTADPDIAAVTLDGTVLGVSAASTELRARGPRGSEASVTVTVE